ncbi:hypothetical protein AU184_02605 [Mycolicibacterium novocastrense]|nr:hypothetical protein AU072_05100 [Mycolicibacterium novocastrense]KUH72561.1 hypothetical protein AU184_02605 [Mycolicibacterium novocastrense]KUH78477.1 hypothetical protein AU183_07990 [Mycolicibacterium novocastrense]
MSKWGVLLHPIAVIAVLAMALASCSGEADGPARQEGPSPEPAGSVTGSVWVANEDGDSMTVIDASTNAVIATLDGIEEPHNVQVGAGGDTVYAVSGSENLLVAIDAATFAVAATAPTGAEPAHVIEANGKVYVTNAADGTVSVYRSPGLQPTGRITLGGMPHGLRPAGDGSVIVVANTMAGALDVIDPATDTLLGSAPVGRGPAQVAVTADGRYAYTGISEPSSVAKVDLATRTVVGTAPTPTSPVQVFLTPDGETVVSADQGTRDRPGNTASVIDTRSMTVRSRVDTGSGPHGVVIDDTGTRAWVTNSYSDTVSVIELATSSVGATVRTGAEPTGISYSVRRPAPGASTTTTLKVPEPATSNRKEPSNDHGH